MAIEARSRMLELVPPGRVIFLRPLKVHGARAGWDAVWVKAEEVIREVRSRTAPGAQRGCGCSAGLLLLPGPALRHRAAGTSSLSCSACSLLWAHVCLHMCLLPVRRPARCQDSRR